MAKTKTTTSGGKNFEDVSFKGRTYVDMKTLKKGTSFTGDICEIVHKPKKGKYAEQEQIVLQTENGEIGFPSHFTLNTPILGRDNERKDEAKGLSVRFTYNGQTAAKGDKKGTHLWKVEVAK